MATTATRTRAAAPATTAVVPASLSHDDLMALLGQAGAVAQGGEFHRLTLKGGVLETDDGQMFPPRKDAPSLTVRIVRPPVYYNAIFLSDKPENGSFDAGEIGRDDLNGRFTRKYDDPNEQANDQNPANAIYDEVVRLTGQKGSFKADVQVQIVPESGVLTGDEPIYTLTLSTTSVFEWRGSSRNQDGGSVSEKNFMVKLAELALTQAVEAGGDETAQKTAVLNALTSLRVGGVVADVSLLRAEDDKKTRTWWVVSFTPVHIEPADGGAAPALPAGESAGDVPF